MIPLKIFVTKINVYIIFVTKNVSKTLEKNSMFAIRWFENNYLKLKTEKCHLIISGYKQEQVLANIGQNLIGKVIMSNFLR